MQSNIIERRKQEVIVNKPVTVICVVDDLAEKNDIILNMRKFCKENRVNFHIRLFNSTKYSDDRHNIYRLPAFHVTIKKNYLRTFYPNTRPYQHVLECIDIYDKQSAPRKNRVFSIFNSIKALFTRIFRKPAKKNDKVLDW